MIPTTKVPLTPLIRSNFVLSTTVCHIWSPAFVLSATVAQNDPLACLANDRF